MSEDPSHLEDLQLIARANNGEEQAFHALYDKYKQWTINTAYRFTKDPELALDVMQEVFLQLVRKFPGFSLSCKMTTYLYTVTHHTAINMQKKARRQQPIANTAEMADHPANNEAPDPIQKISDPREEMEQLLEALSPAHRETLLLRFVDDMDLADIAEATGVPLGTVKSRLHHTLAKLKEDPKLKKLFGD